jgi:putative acetyltransferase
MTASRFSIVEDDLTGAAILQLLSLHLADVRSLSPAASVHALPVERLRQADGTFWSVWAGEEIAACGALKEIDAAHGEVKSMRAAPAWRGTGAGRAVLVHIMGEARRRGYARLSLETGSASAFLPARKLYAAMGFVECGPFADYIPDPWSVFMTLEL